MYELVSLTATDEESKYSSQENFTDYLNKNLTDNGRHKLQILKSLTIKLCLSQMFENKPLINSIICSFKKSQ